VNRLEFEHVIRAAAAVVNDEIVVIGSQAVLAQNPHAPDALLQSAEVDVFPRSDPARADEIDGAIGDGSRFHETYAYYAHGVGPETLVAPAGWEERLVRLELPPVRRKDGTVVAWCLEVHDLVLAKLAAGRPHDYEFVEEAIRFGVVDRVMLRLGVDLLPNSHRELVRERLGGMIAKARTQGEHATDG
jgi:hypothetical protein